ncbi:SPX domain-containing protein [Rutstroemia sp. NJR-2017a BVV2]|nr:SPX domain-containing protein [Rutstroemia sp. NJR-2017a BVV2]
MKYGQHFRAESVPQWAAFNLDYDELKHLIKKNTTRNHGQGIAIPGHTDTALNEFESSFYTELANQHDRVGLFVKSKSDEISRRLHATGTFWSALETDGEIGFFQTIVPKLLERCSNSDGRITQKRLNKFSKYDAQIQSCGDELLLLERFIEAQRVAFYKLLKKYMKWTGSRALTERFNSEILGDPKSFTRLDLSNLHSQYNDLITLLRASTPANSKPASPQGNSRRSSVQHQQVAQSSQRYWNEYDDGSEHEEEPYYIYYDPNAESTFPGAKAMKKAYEVTKAQMEKVKEWMTPPTSPERASLLGSSHSRSSPNGTFTDNENEPYASSTDLPGGYITHYATFPSVSDQRVSLMHERICFILMISCYLLSAVFLTLSATFLATGRRKLRLEVDLGALLAAILGMFLAVVGLGGMLQRKDRLGWIHQGIVLMTFILLCGAGIILLVMITGN